MSTVKTRRRSSSQLLSKASSDSSAHTRAATPHAAGVVVPETSPFPPDYKMSRTSSNKWSKWLTRRGVVAVTITACLCYFLLTDSPCDLYPYVIRNSSNPDAAEYYASVQAANAYAAEEPEEFESDAEHSDRINSILAPLTTYTPEAETEEVEDKDDLRYRLSTHFPYRREMEIPKIIWQTWKEPLQRVKNNEIRKYMHSWVQQSDYEHRLITDDDLDEVVETLYADFPEVIETYHLLPMKILKFDFLRYLVLFARGGVYTDVDTLSLKNLKEWADNKDELSELFPDLPDSHEVGFVVGVEGDYDRADWKFKTSRRLQFCQWSFKSKAGHPILREIITRIVETTLKRYSARLNHVKIGKEYFTLHSVYTVLEWTGPAVFTDSIFSHFNKVAKQEEEVYIRGINKEVPKEIQHTEFEPYHKEKNSITKKKGVGWTNFTRLTHPAMFDDVMVLPIASFNGFVEGMDFEINEELIYLRHEFHGTWKDL